MNTSQVFRLKNWAVQRSSKNCDNSATKPLQVMRTLKATRPRIQFQRITRSHTTCRNSGYGMIPSLFEDRSIIGHSLP